MDAYLEIRLLPDPEFPPTTLMNALFSKLHRGLVAHGGRNIGVSFPDVGKNGRSLGERLRLHGSRAELEKLMTSNWLVGMRDHATVSEITEVPACAKQRMVRRVQAKSSPERQRRRLIARKGITTEQAMQSIPDGAAEKLNLPYLILTSQSTGQQFRLFVEHLAIQEQAVKGEFGAYGLSSIATIPWF
ncbi:MAG: type I-F CRISPR-associated endoribonuclease Cas6/Csy4 [Candidatus Competibacteraceae bacterium]|nr:type I-F CRISPR-associated endoribonuclease Cas6/Csy4 [Candidatus Competibacteraceae bacterium]MCP5124902.1 type I-F CRISPR-associated endoribonuclease Cas6/Csy4 [Gammaproteobacteria bacterium]HRX70990.1 type I-F CRISPR-associated endoribonuclease Cas6/Csy4 [Candidatus Competibacteraceae bacterium]